MAKKYDDFDEEGQDGFFDQILTIVSKRKRGFAVASVAAAVVLLGLVVFGNYNEDTETAANESVPIVRADAGEYKATPDNPGGMEIPYRDSTVFNAANNDSGPENILADDSSEDPVPRSQLFAGLNTEGDQPGGAPVTEEPVAAAPTGEMEANNQFAKAASVEPPADDALVKEAIGAPAEETTAAPTQTAAVAPEAVKPAPVPKEEPVAEAKEAAKIESAAGTTSTKAVSGGSHYVQLASVKNTAGAAAEFKKLQVKYSALGGVKYRTQEANLGAKGTFYRIQAGPMSKEEATRICTDIKGKGGSCLVAAK